MFEGVSIAIVTPFADGQVDEAGLRRVIAHVLDQGVDGIVATGSTGEAPTLNPEERERVWRIAVEAARGKAFVLAGTGTNDTEETVARTRRAATLGVDGCLVVAPYYNKPQPRGLLAHFRRVADASDVPLMLYNVPSRTAVNLPPAVITELAAHPRIVAVKEASGSCDQATEILLGSSITVVSGEDAGTLPLAALGARGVVSVAGHLVGRELKEMLSLQARGKAAEAAVLHRRLYPLVKALFAETNPAPLKAALARLGLIRDEVRPPLAAIGEETARTLFAVMNSLGLAAPSRAAS
jgi:4-hydroxy-tetrahydrodipicolinate synthase